MGAGPARAQLEAATTDQRGPIAIVGPPGSGKTTALAAYAAQNASDGCVAVVCSHEASCAAFERAFAPHRAGRIVVGTLGGHLARWMREDFLASGASPELTVGGDADSEALARSTGSSILDMSWPGFRAADFTLDLPFLSRPDKFFSEVAALFRQLRQARVTVTGFENTCTSGTAAFYGDRVERARVLCADGQVRGRASKRGKDALSASASALEVQRHADSDLASMLAHLYGAYRAASAGARVLCPEDVIDEGLAWLERDEHACERIAQRLAALVIDDAEDAEAGTTTLIELLTKSGLRRIALAGCTESAIDGMGGRRSALAANAELQLTLPPRIAPDRVRARRFKDEVAEADAIAGDVDELLSAGVATRDIAILARDLDAAGVYARLLSTRKVPVVAPVDAWQSPHEIADLLALASIVDDPYDHAHLLRVLASPLVGLDDRSLWLLCRDAPEATQLALEVEPDEPRGERKRSAATATTLAQNALYGLADHELRDTARAALQAFRRHWLAWRSACSGLRPPALISHLITAAGFQNAWSGADPHVRFRLHDDGARLIEMTAGMSSSRPAASVRRTIEAIEEGAVRPRRAADSPDAVPCEPVLNFKGRSVPCAFVAGIAHERFPRVYVSRAMAFSKTYGLIVRENVAGGAAQTAKFAWYYAKFGAKARYLEEEARVLSYALSRGDRAVSATGFGKPPRWAADQDLLAKLEPGSGG